MSPLLFYFFAFFLVMGALMVISLKNPVHSVLFLIFTFFNAASLFILLGAEFLAMTLIIVYVGAVAVLFLFVVMMLNINITKLRQGFLRNAPIGLGLGALIFIQIYIALSNTVDSFPSNLAVVENELTNTEMLGKVIYTDYFFAFQSSGVLLLIAMIGAIVLTLEHGRDVKRQSIFKQVYRSKKDSVKLVKVKTGEGVKV
jgi:NADH-quinone oxidoreductase subunit J